MLIREEETLIGTIYKKVSNENELLQKIAAVGFVKEKDNQTFFILTDLYGNRLKDANAYLNITLGNSSYKKRELAYSALKLFYSCMLLHNISTYKNGLEQQELNILINFLKGGKRKGINYDYDFEVSRKNNTVNNYLAVYRDFYERVFNVKDSSIHRKKTIATTHGNGFLGHAFKNDTEKFSSNMRIRNHNNVPKYIKKEEYEKIMELVDTKYSIREMTIIKLMYEYGLRLGEVLGLTFEDIEEIDGGYYKLILRNRLSDKQWQSVKSVMNIKSEEDYLSDEFHCEGTGLGYQSVIIDSDTKSLIDEYIEETRDEFVLNQSETKRKNLETKAKADRVTKNELFYDENQYIFLNQQHYTPLTAAGWSFSLKKIFKELNIEIDEKTKKNNLSHRFRHGFAMNKVKAGFTQEELAVLLRHSDISTVKVYFNPDEEYKVGLLKKQKDYMSQGGISFEENIR